MDKELFHVERLYRPTNDSDHFVSDLSETSRKVGISSITALTFTNPTKSSIGFLWTLRSNGLDIISKVDHPSKIFKLITHIPMGNLGSSCILLVAEPNFEGPFKFSDVYSLFPHLVITYSTKVDTVNKTRIVLDREGEEKFVVQNGFLGVKL